MSSRMGYTRLHVWHLSPEPSGKSFTGALQRGHTKISSKSCRTAMQSLRAEVRRECDFIKVAARAANRCGVTSWIFREFQSRLYRAATCSLDFAYFDAGVPSSLGLDPA